MTLRRVGIYNHDFPSGLLIFIMSNTVTLSPIYFCSNSWFHPFLLINLKSHICSVNLLVIILRSPPSAPLSSVKSTLLRKVYKETLIKSSSVIHPHFSNSVVLSISLPYYHNNTCVKLIVSIRWENTTKKILARNCVAQKVSFRVYFS